MNPGNSEPHLLVSESSLQTSRKASKRPRHDPSGGGDERDGEKYPSRNVAIDSFECPFCKHDPHRYAECRGHRLIRLSDVTQHISRRHWIGEVRLGLETLKEGDVVLYCARCRYLFRGRGAAHRLEVHMNQQAKCQPANIEQSGVTIPVEFEAIKSKIGSCKGESEEEKWFIIWKILFPGQQPPLSPYREISLPRQEVESILQNELQSLPGLSQEAAELIVQRSVHRIFNISGEPRNRPPVPRQAQSNVIQTAPVLYMPAGNPAFPYQSLQPQTRDFDHRSIPQLGVYYGTPIQRQRDNSLYWNNTLINRSAPSLVPGSGAHNTSRDNFVGPGFLTAPDSVCPSHAPYVGYPNASFEPAVQDDDYSNV